MAEGNVDKILKFADTSVVNRKIGYLGMAGASRALIFSAVELSLPRQHRFLVRESCRLNAVFV